MKRGIAPLIAAKYGADKFPVEMASGEGDMNKLGMIDYMFSSYDGSFNHNIIHSDKTPLAVVNCYSQYHWTQKGRYNIPLDYDALALCFAKINQRFKGKALGIPKIGCGLAGGNWNDVRRIIGEELGDLKSVTVVILPD